MECSNDNVHSYTSSNSHSAANNATIKDVQLTQSNAKINENIIISSCVDNDSTMLSQYYQNSM